MNALLLDIDNAAQMLRELDQRIVHLPHRVLGSGDAGFIARAQEHMATATTALASVREEIELVGT